MKWTAFVREKVVRQPHLDVEECMLSTSENYLVVLQKEFSAEPESFIIELVAHCDWNEQRFQHLADAMETCCENMKSMSEIPRWLARGFWFTPDYVASWVSRYIHGPDNEYSRDYLLKCVERLNDLAYFFFYGEPITQQNKSP